MRRDVEVGDGYCLSRDGLNREPSCPSITRTNNAFTYFRRGIKHVRVSPNWFGG